ncbi:MAG: 1-acyl-sn-glycerol-3-phosphate acyltransferase [Alphaproteobacteria bacterium]|nr:1-acyl-sn-glycerol-3-phosphate acyltransferase [Alphaproteobacteria bacterium]MBU2084758.1 1-acyl-sn-glycerol-3-phosphate acyltransferase [Alphaproteobacteria bacterium]MBU2144164.1 1-acyl-sn-glycerol-3-phosphate acyltransferase [Alphaproteobacteria bacterium]MBU2198279.1 1-acyl-sn-glycerol-3-phosphate acyltransferase [Alphaproteobacteria bacterium]
MMQLRSLLFVAYLYGTMALMGTVFIIALFLPRVVIMRGIRIYAKSLRWGMKVICGIETEFRGLENIPDGPFMYAGKHQCMFDIFVPFIVVRDSLIIMKRELLWYPFLGWYALKSDMIPIDRAGSTKTLRSMVKQAKAKVLSGRGRQVVIFPEGTRTAPGATPHYHAAGVVALYKALDVPVLPVATNAGLCWPAHGTRRRPGRIVYEFLPVIPAGMDRKALMKRLESDIETATDKLVTEGLAIQGRTRLDEDLQPQ